MSDVKHLNLCNYLYDSIHSSASKIISVGNASVCHHINSRILLLSQRIRKIMSSSSDSDREGDEWYEIVDVLDDAMYLDSEDGWADDEGDTVIEINGDRPTKRANKMEIYKQMAAYMATGGPIKGRLVITKC